MANPPVLVYADGNFGQATPGLPRDLPQTLLMAPSGWCCSRGCSPLSRPRHRDTDSRDRFPRRIRSWVLTLLGALGLALLGVIGWVLYDLPALPIIPPTQIAAGAAGTLPGRIRHSSAVPSRPMPPTEQVHHGTMTMIAHY